MEALPVSIYACFDKDELVAFESAIKKIITTQDPRLFSCVVTNGLITFTTEEVFYTLLRVFQTFYDSETSKEITPPECLECMFGLECFATFAEYMIGLAKPMILLSCHHPNYLAIPCLEGGRVPC